MSNPESDNRTRRTENFEETAKKLKRQVEKLEARVAKLEGHKCKCGSKDKDNEEAGNLLAHVLSKW